MTTTKTMYTLSTNVFNVLLLLFGTLFTFSCDSPTSPTDKTPPNLVILFADDMGYGDLSCYGHPTIYTPHLDQMAQEGLKLTSFYVSVPACSPSRASLLSGRYAQRVGVPGVLGPASKGGISIDAKLIPEWLQEAGYQTAAVGKWHLGHANDEHYPTHRGFDQFLGLLYSNDMIKPWVQTDAPLNLMQNAEILEHPVDTANLTLKYTEEAVDFIEARDKEKPFFLYLAYNMPHLPIHAPDTMKGKSRAGLYGDVIETVDWSVGQVMQALKEQGLDDNTLIIFASDNGPWIDLPDRMLQAGNERWHVGVTGGLRGSKANTYEGGVRVPCIMHWPGVIQKGRQTAELVTALDVLPSALNMLGLEIPKDYDLDGFDMSSLIKGESEKSPRDTFYYTMGRRLEGMRNGKWKLRLTNQKKIESERQNPPLPELFDLEVDPHERHNLAERYPDIVEAMKSSMLEFGRELSLSMEFDTE